MKNTILLFIIFLLIANCELLSQDNDWQLLSEKTTQGNHFVMKQNDNITYIVNSSFTNVDRENIVNKTNEYITQNLRLIGEKEFKESITIIFLADQGETHKLFGKRQPSFSLSNEEKSPSKQIVCIYSPQCCSLNQELISIMAQSKWGILKDNKLLWIKDGLSNLATFESDSCERYSLEERYISLLKEKQLTELNKIPPHVNNVEYRAYCIQSAYIVKYLLINYGTDKIKQLWQNGMSHFQTIYKSSLDEIIDDFNKPLYAKKLKNGSREDDSMRDCLYFQFDDWLPAYNPPSISNKELNKMVTKIDGNLEITVDSVMSIPERDFIVEKTKEYILQNLAFIREPEFNDSISIFIVRNREQMNEFVGRKIAGITHIADDNDKTNRLISIFNSNHHPLKHELMHMITFLKWGKPNGSENTWLIEGLATLVCPEAENCDGHTFEERYIYFSQNDRLLDLKMLNTSLQSDKMPQIKIAYSQAAYIVGYLIENYGVDKIKRLWQNGMDNFENIFEASFQEIASNINSKLKNKGTDRFDFNEDRFYNDCIE